MELHLKKKKKNRDIQIPSGLKWNLKIITNLNK